MQKYLLVFLNLAFFVVFGQEKEADTTLSIQQNYSDMVDELWLETMYSSPLNNEILATDQTAKNTTKKQAIIDIPTALLKERLEVLNQETPFHVEYNPVLEKLIKTYLKKRAIYYPKMMARAAYYFPMFEAHLDKYDIPLEIKYLAVVESALNPRAKSGVGATGIWQFMYRTGKQFDLQISSYVDERQDPVKSSEAACKYLLSLYKVFNDWDLALAAYNSGPGNVSKAIRRSGGNRNYWNIRPFLPRETAGYLPAFYATMYIFTYAKEHEIHPVAPLVQHFETDTIQVKQLLTFEQLAEDLDLSIEMLQFLNPAYKLDIIPYVKSRNYTLRLPRVHMSKFVENEQKIYQKSRKELAQREKPLPEYFEMNQRIRHKVRNGDYLGKIAYRYGVKVSDIKKWNGMRTSNIRVGQRLVIYPKRLNYTVSKGSGKKTNKKYKSKPIGKKITYTIQDGDSLWIIAKKFPKVTIQQIKEWNSFQNPNHLKPGDKIFIYKRS